MALSVPEQVNLLVTKASSVLIVFKTDGTVDSIATSLALYLYLKKMGKHVEVASAGFTPSKKLTFLPGISAIKGALAGAQKTILSVDIAGRGLASLAYDAPGDTLKIFITPKNGSINAGDVSVRTSDFTFDLIIVVDTQDLESLGVLYARNPELFFKTPLITIDNDPANEHFGQINLVEMTATSAAEVAYHTLEALGKERIDAAIATCLLTGMIAETKSFKTPQVTPHTLSIASRLIDAGANREQIVEFLYRTKSIAALKLWGRALSRLDSDSALGLVWTTVTKDDFLHAGAAEHDLPELVHELINTTPEARVSAVFYECPGKDKTVCALVSSERAFDARMLTKPFEPSGSRHFVRLEFKDKSVHDVRTTVTDNIKKILAEVK